MDEYGVFPPSVGGGTYKENEGLVYYFKLSETMGITVMRFPDRQLRDTDTNTREEFLDPWGVPYMYEYNPAAANRNNDSFVDLASAGPDKYPGTNWRKDNNLKGAVDDNTDANADGIEDVIDNINNWSTKY
jgi:hypothetical protein